MADAREKPGLLDSCLLAFVQSKTLSSVMISELSQIVKQHGAGVLEPDRKGKIRIPQATHIIANTIDFEQYVEAQAMMIPVVTSAWIKTTVARGKVAQVRPYSPDPRMIFSNVILTCADIPNIDKETIIGATMALGGMEAKDLTRLTTHICALSMDHPKCIEAQKKSPKCKIVLPHWFGDCFRLGKRIDEGPYLLPDPEILRKGAEEEIKIPLSQDLQGATSADPNAILPSMQAERRREKLVVFAQKKVMFSSDLLLNMNLEKTLAGLVNESGGEIVQQVDDCDIFVCRYRDGPDYVKAAQNQKNVGNLSWLYHLIVQNEWTSPFRRLLHYPIPKDGIPGFKDMKITLSNYGGDARTYLENLITASGATYTKTMKAENTHLITARMHGEKCEAAKDWNIEIVNHLWIEESYSKCKVQSLTNAKYHHFPQRTNLGEVIGQMFLDERMLQNMFYPGGEENLDSATRKKRKIMKDAQENVYKVGTPADFDMMKNSSPVVPRAAKKARAVQARSYATPAKAHILSGKENDTPSILSTGSRSAKAQALSKLQDMAPDIALYEKEKKRSAKDTHAPWGGKRAADYLDKEHSVRTSSLGEVSDDEDEAQGSSSKRPSKRPKLSLPQVDMRICITSYHRWSVGGKGKEEADKKKLRNLGIHIVQESAICDYLAAPRVVRTKKFLMALTRGPEVISSSFIDECLDTGKRPDPKDHLLIDEENEKKYGVKLDVIVSRARAVRGRLLIGVPIYCTVDIRNGVDSYQAIAEANGAIFKTYRARSGTTIKPTTPEEDGGAAPEPVYLLSSTKPSEKQLWPRFEQMAERGNMEPRIVVADWLLDVAMKQELTFNPKYLASNFSQKP
ncbi:hypothetical protein B0H67DRAFT_494925 [Lasiosphaeris hirsuta]|uniref:BRCT domain-containing protein n=1 Tax=Lasiosphaeris hirsuta TaxID=260670 RepID=A0AA40A318_9PEZI|nr:hypothetical protein B0H67DRAFT_494925 [Lasiosphaeris hirsuta]